MKLYFARHGQTDWNIARRVQGTTDIPLNETGRKQALDLLANLRTSDARLSRIYSSYQQRALETAQCVGQGLGIEVQVMPGLEEMNLGVFEGHTWEEIDELFPAELATWHSNKRYNPAPQGESYQMVLERLFTAIDQAIADTRPDTEEAPSPTASYVPEEALNSADSYTTEGAPNATAGYTTEEDKDLLFVSHGAVIMTLVALKNKVPFDIAYAIDIKNAVPICFTLEEVDELRKLV